MSFRTQSNSSGSTTSSGKKRHSDHYLRLFLRKIWFIAPMFSLAILGWLFTIHKLDLNTPALEATAVLHFDDPDQLSAVQERINLKSETKAVLIRSRTFLEYVVQKLSLQLQTLDYSRYEIFDSVKVEPGAQVGLYTLKVSKNGYVIQFTDLNKITSTVKKGDISLLAATSLPGVSLRWSEEFKAHPFTVKFKITRLRDAVDFIAENIVIKTTGKDGIVMSISLKGKDYDMITATINTIADDFVRQNGQTQFSRKAEVIKILDKQLKAAHLEMLEAQAVLKRYREANPTVGLADAFSPPVTILDLKDAQAELRSAILQGEVLKQRYGVTADSNRISLIGEIVAFLIKYQAPTAEAFASQQQVLSDETRKLALDYAPHHPLAVKNRKEITELGTKVSLALIELIKELNRKVGENNLRIRKTNSEIAALPAKELHLSNLQRKYDVTSEVYANVLTRYNEAKIAQAVEIGDVYVLDHAVSPEPLVNIKTLLALIVAGLVLGVCIGFGPVLALDYFDRTARTEKELHHMTDISVLESIPVKGSWIKQVRPDMPALKKLVAANYTQDFTDETYRSLRAKILLALQGEKRKRILVTSLGIGEGKSFTAANMAITMAQQRIPTLLVDGDLRRGIQHIHFNVQKNPGLSTILSSSDPLGNLQINQIIQRTHIPNLSIIGSGPTVPYSAELLNSSRFRDLLNRLADDFEVIIFDTPPVAVTTDAVGIQDVFHKYIFVVKAAHTDIAELNRKIREFPGLRKKVMGIVLNGAPYKRTEYYQYTSYKYKTD